MRKWDEVEKKMEYWNGGNMGAFGIVQWLIGSMEMRQSGDKEMWRHGPFALMN